MIFQEVTSKSHHYLIYIINQKHIIFRCILLFYIIYNARLPWYVGHIYLV